MLAKELWYKEALDKDKALQRLYRELEDIEWVKQGPTYIPSDPTVMPRLDKMLRRLGIDPLNPKDKRLPGWISPYIFEYMYPNYRKKIRDIYTELWNTPWWKFLHAGPDVSHFDANTLEGLLESVDWQIQHYGYGFSDDLWSLENRWGKLKEALDQAELPTDGSLYVSPDKTWGEALNKPEIPHWFRS